MDFPEIPLWFKFLIAISWDIFDLTIGRIPIFGSFTDFISGILAIVLWGYAGIIAFWEVADVTDQIDSLVPTLTLIGIISWYMNKGHDAGEIASNISVIKRGVK